MSNGAPYLALDIGLHRTGIALSESGHLARPLTTVSWKAPHATPMLEEVVTLCRHHDIQTIIVGLPLEEDGGVTDQALKTELIIEKLKALLDNAKYPIEIIRANEFHSTQDALHRFPNVDKDAAAAALILQDYLDEQESTW